MPQVGDPSQDLHQQASLAYLDALRQCLWCVRMFDGHIALGDHGPRIVVLGDHVTATTWQEIVPAAQASATACSVVRLG